MMDTTGRYFGGNEKFYCSKLTMKILAFMRLINVALFILCFKLGDEFLYSTFGDIIKILNVMVFAFLNGYLQTLCSCWAPDEITDTKKRDKVGQMVGLSVNFGIITGSLISIVVENML